MGVFVFNCPHCGKQIGAQDEWEGKMTMCPHCQKPVMIRHEMPNPPSGEIAQPMMSTWGDYEAGPPEVSKNAKNAMWFGIAGACCSFCCCGPIFSVIAFVLGVMGLNEISKSNGRLEGKSYAWIGIVLAILPWIMTFLQTIYAPQLLKAYEEFFEKYQGAKYRIESYEEEKEEIPIKPLPEPKNNQKEDSEPENKSQPEDNMKPVEPTEPIKLPPARRPRPEELI